MEGNKAPRGNLVLRTLAMPADTNPAGDIFGGWIMAQMDIAGGIMARELTGTRIVTVAVESITFIKPVWVGDVVCCYGDIVRIGTTSVTVNLEVWVKPSMNKPDSTLAKFQVTKAAFTYVSVDAEGKKLVIQRKENDI
jgi:acyl-CoA thioesterase YciA